MAEWINTKTQRRKDTKKAGIKGDLKPAYFVFSAFVSLCFSILVLNVNTIPNDPGGHLATRIAWAESP